jgi:hypothetical protein
MVKHFKEGDNVHGKIKSNTGYKGVILSVTPKGKKYFYTVKWSNGRVECNVSQRAIGEPGKPTSNAKGQIKQRIIANKRGITTYDDSEEDDLSSQSSDTDSDSSDSNSETSMEGDDDDR